MPLSMLRGPDGNVSANFFSQWVGGLVHRAPASVACACLASWAGMPELISLVSYRIMPNTHTCSACHGAWNVAPFLRPVSLAIDDRRDNAFVVSLPALLARAPSTRRNTVPELIDQSTASRFLGAQHLFAEPAGARDAAGGIARSFSRRCCRCRCRCGYDASSTPTAKTAAELAAHSHVYWVLFALALLSPRGTSRRISISIVCLTSIPASCGSLNNFWSPP